MEAILRLTSEKHSQNLVKLQSNASEIIKMFSAESMINVIQFIWVTEFINGFYFIDRFKFIKKGKKLL